MGLPSRIILVDDNRSEALLISEAFNDALWNAELEAVASGRALLAALRRHAIKGSPPHLILLDLHIPGESVTHTLASIRATPTCAKMPIILVSTDRPNEAMMRTYEPFGVLRILQKPLDFARTITFVKILRSFLHGTGNISAGGSWQDPDVVERPGGS
jgi:CheY-like chemotaxis protein